MDISKVIAEELKVKIWQVEAAVKLIDDGCTIPFIARYRKEATGELHDDQLRTLGERLEYLRNLEEKKAQVIGSIEEQGMMTDELKAKIENAQTVTAVDDLYRPYRPKRKTRAGIAKEKGLDPLAQLIMEQKTKKPVIESAAEYVDGEKGVNSAEEALQGAMDIIAENISDNADYRTYIRNATMNAGLIVSEAKNDKQESVYENYYHFSEGVSKIAGHRILAINRGETEKILTVTVEAPAEEILRYLGAQIIAGRKENKGLKVNSDNAFGAALAKAVMTEKATPNKYTESILENVIKDSYERLIAPSIEREIRNMLTEKAEDGAISVFGKNLHQLLMQPPIANKVVLGWDPAFRTGCKIAVVDGTGKVLDTTVIFPTAPQFKVAEAKAELKKLIAKYKVDLISVGNGTASRESEQVIVELLKELDRPVKYIIVNEAGASVYSASKLASEEFPNFDVGQRSAASIARRLQDPLAELVKIDPKSIGVGQYQHDMNQKKLGDTLGGVVETCVNSVGVDLNTASASLLGYISGISGVIAKNIVAYREANGRFISRAQLLKVPKLGPKAYEQCAGFLRISGGKEPLDGTSVHPETYAATEKLLEKMGLTTEVIGKTDNALLKQRIASLDKKKTAEELGIGEITLGDILKELIKPSRDPREEMPLPVLRSDILEMKDLKPGMILKGTVRNVIDFGAFVDIGVHQDGLVHISQICDRYIKHPLEAVSIGDVVDVQVISVDPAKKRISLTMKIVNSKQ